MLSFLDRGLDEMAAGARAGFFPRLLANLAVALIAMAFLPWTTCALWAAVTAGADFVSWLVTRDQHRGIPVGWGKRLQHVACLIVGIVNWTALGVMLWATGTAAGAICGLVLWLSVMAFAQVYAYQSRAGYLIAVVPSAAAILVTPLLAPNAALATGLHGGWPVWFLLVVAVGFSVSSARQTMDARRRYEQAIEDLRQSEQSYRLLADNVTDVISLASADNRRLYVSPSIEKVLKFSPGELLVTPNYTYMHPDDTEAVQAFIRGTTEETGPRTLDYRVFAKDGSTVWAETTFTRLTDGSGRLLAVSRDVTQRKALEDELKDALARAEAAARAKTDFLANMTHELRTPLTAILGFAGVLKGSESMSAQDARHAGLIHDASQTLLGVIGDVLDYSKIEAGAFELDPEPFDPAQTARSAVAIVEAQAGAKGLAIAATIDGAPPALMGDAPRLRQVLLNFLSNAVKFTREGGVELRLTHEMAGGACRLRVEVVDSGIGIEPEHLGALFNRFTQADASVSRRFGGTGLGLAISKQIVEAMGGRIGADSVVGQGSTFWFEVELPVAAEKVLYVEADPAAAAALDRSIRMLVVEDNAVNRELLATLLSPFDIEIDMACDGAEAVEAAARGGYDIILMDMQMPVM
ncbi:MAG: PAS domain S-box protein, partial [Proteobacteria bacterium]|nr:PAS domain S-box protein [Pseudomonadota bacterium]